MKPTPDMPAKILRKLFEGIDEAIEIVDISTSGMALSFPEKLPIGQAMKLRLMLGAITHEIAVEVRWSAGGMVGLEFVDLTEATALAVQRYVGELLERGA